MAKSPLMVPGADCNGLVAPKMALPCLTTSLPSQTVAKTGPITYKIIKMGKMV